MGFGPKGGKRSGGTLRCLEENSTASRVAAAAAAPRHGASATRHRAMMPDLVAGTEAQGQVMIIGNEKDVTTAVLSELARAPNPRFREVMSAFVRHLHELAREVKLTEEEFQA